MRRLIYNVYDSVMQNMFIILNIFIALAATFLLMTLINVNIEAAHRQSDNARILRSIRESTETLICMDLVPQEQRTTDKAKQCRKDAVKAVTNEDSTGGVSTPPKTSTPSSIKTNAPTASPTTPVATQPTQPAPTPEPTPTPKPNNGGVTIDLPLLPPIHIPSPL